MTKMGKFSRRNMPKGRTMKKHTPKGRCMGCKSKSLISSKKK